MFIEVQRYKLSLKHKNNQLINFQKREGFRDQLREGSIQTLPFCIPSIYTGSEAKREGVRDLFHGIKIVNSIRIIQLFDIMFIIMTLL